MRLHFREIMTADYINRLYRLLFTETNIAEVLTTLTAMHMGHQAYATGFKWKETRTIYTSS